jgi:hypothetical protein
LDGKEIRKGGKKEMRKEKGERELRYEGNEIG